MTCWVEYRLPGSARVPDSDSEPMTPPGTYELVNAYVHRMKIELEPVWKGRKIGEDFAGAF